MNRSNILMIVPDTKAGEAIRQVLEDLDYEVSQVLSGAEGLALAVARPWDLVVVGFGLSDMLCFDVCRELRESPKSSALPVVVVSPRDEECDIVAALELGAHDYVVEPVNARIFASRVRSLLRQTSRRVSNRQQIIEIHGLTISPGHRAVSLGSSPVELTHTEFELLHLFARYPGQVFGRREILKQLRGDGSVTSERAVDVQIAGLRRRLGAYGNRIETVRGVGYRLRVN